MNVYQPGMPPLEDLPIHRDKDSSQLEGDEGQTAWRCRICGYVHYAEQPPQECPYCFFPESAFKEVS
jgi:acyl-CoA dehydrogenase